MRFDRVFFFNFLKRFLFRIRFFHLLGDTEEVTEEVFYGGVEEGILYA